MTTTFDEAAAPVIRDLAQAAQDPSELEPGKVYAWLADGQVHQIDLTGDEYRDYPKRKTGTVTVRDVASFKLYWDKHHDDASEVYADLDKATVTAILDAHHGHAAGDLDETEQARWQEHRLILKLEPTLPWTRWTGKDRQMLPQQQFAEFVEDNASDVDPEGRVKAADLLEIAQTFQAHTSVKFTSGKRLQSGQAQFQYIEETTASGGGQAGRGTIEIPTEFDLLVRPYEDCDLKVVAARFRYRIQGGNLTLGFFMNDPARHARESITGIVEKLEGECGVTVMHGRPA